MKSGGMTVNPGGIEARRGQVTRSGTIVVAESEQNGMNAKREDTERRRRRRNRKEIITETEPGNQHQRRVIGMRLKLRFVCT